MAGTNQGIDRIEELRPGDHLCTIYDSDEQHRALLTRFIAAGLARGERVLYVVDARTGDTIRAYLADAGVDPADAERRDQLWILAQHDTYLRDDRFDPDAMIELLAEETERARADGFTALRITGEMSWVLRGLPGSERLVEYEAKLNRFFPGRRALALCQYDRRRFDASVLLDVLRTHPLAAVGDELMDNPHYVPPEELLADPRPDRELDHWIARMRERDQLIARLREGEDRYRLLFERMVSGYALHTLIEDGDGEAVDYRFDEANPAFEALTGLDAREIVGRTVLEVLPDLELDWIRRYPEVVRTGEVDRFTMYSEALDRHYEVVAFPADGGRFGTLFHDVTERLAEEQRRQEFERQVYEAQKLESLGLLAGGIAHDFNNMLVGILGNAGLAREEIPATSPAVECLDDIELAARRASELSRQLLAYAGRGKFVVRPLSVRSLIEEMTQLIEVSLPKNVHLRLYLGDADAVVEADAAQLRQVVLNLIVNGAEAIGSRSGAITISCGGMFCDEDYLYSSFGVDDLPEGRYVTIEISDTGSGMDAETLARIFDPFFSTKRHGRGLGLAAVVGIVRGHGGALRVYSEVGRGSTFKLLLPASVDDPPSHGSLDDSREQLDALGGGTVLVVDDEEAVRTVARRALVRMGLEVLTAEDGRAGLAIYEARRDEIALVLLDMMMPGMGGKETLTELRRVDPGVRVVLTSGYNEQDAISQFAGRGLVGFLQKPWQPKELRELVVRALREDEPAD